VPAALAAQAAPGKRFDGGFEDVTPLPAGGDSRLASSRGWLPQLLLQFAAVTV